MHKIILAILGVMMMSGYTQAEDGHFFDRNGNPRGRTQQVGSRTYVLDQNGNHRGYSMMESGRTVYYDNNGNRVGSFQPSR